MKYRIGDVSRILGISDQMIRHYEKCGVIHPERSGEGNNRYYTEMDVFLLFEAMKCKEWNINIAEIGEMISEDYFQKLTEKLSAFEGDLSEEITYKQILRERIRQVKKRLQTCRYNMNNVWAELVPAHYLYYMGESKGDSYDITPMDGQMADMIYSSRGISFFDPYAEYDGADGTWWYMIPQAML